MCVGCDWQVKEELDEQCGRDTLHPNSVVALFLVREGASIQIKMEKGVNPLQVCPQDVAQLIQNYASTHSA